MNKNDYTNNRYIGKIMLDRIIRTTVDLGRFILVLIGGIILASILIAASIVIAIIFITIVIPVAIYIAAIFITLVLAICLYAIIKHIIPEAFATLKRRQREKNRKNE